MKINNVQVYGLEDSIVASGYPMRTGIPCLIVDTNDIERANTLGKTAIGSGHDNFLNGIIVQFDLTFSNKAWVELQRYHFIDFVSSQSTMHCITKFDLDKVYNEYVDKRIIGIVKELVTQYNSDPSAENYLKVLYSNPAGFQLTARMTTNYRCLKTIYSQRKNHTLPEWRKFCEWITTLPEAKRLILGDDKNET